MNQINLTLRFTQDPKMLSIQIPGAYTYDGQPFYALALPGKMQEGLQACLQDCLDFYQDRAHFVAFTKPDDIGIRQNATFIVVDYLKEAVSFVEENQK